MDIPIHVQNGNTTVVRFEGCGLRATELISKNLFSSSESMVSEQGLMKRPVPEQVRAPLVLGSCLHSRLFYEISNSCTSPFQHLLITLRHKRFFLPNKMHVVFHVIFEAYTFNLCLSVHVFAQLVFLSEDSVSFGDIPVCSSSSRLLFMINLSHTDSLHFNWDKSHQQVRGHFHFSHSSFFTEQCNNTT